MRFECRLLLQRSWGFLQCQWSPMNRTPNLENWAAKGGLHHWQKSLQMHPDRKEPWTKSAKATRRFHRHLTTCHRHGLTWPSNARSSCRSTHHLYGPLRVKASVRIPPHWSHIQGRPDQQHLLLNKNNNRSFHRPPSSLHCSCRPLDPYNR